MDIWILFLAHITQEGHTFIKWSIKEMESYKVTLKDQLGLSLFFAQFLFSRNKWAFLLGGEDEEAEYVESERLLISNIIFLLP